PSPAHQGGDGGRGVGADRCHLGLETDPGMERKARGVGDDDGVLLPGHRLRGGLRREARVKDRLEILSIGVSHHTAPIAVRERVAVASERLEEALHELCARPGIAEAMIVSTCNRLEIYAAVRGEEGPASARAFLREREPGIDRHLYENRGLSAVRHLFRVCASLDSMVV